VTCVDVNPMCYTIQCSYDVFDSYTYSKDCCSCGMDSLCTCPDPSMDPTFGLLMKKAPERKGRFSDMPQEWIQEGDASSLANFAAAMASFDTGIGSMVGAFSAIMQLFSTKTTTTIIGEETCLGFNTFDDATTINIIQCLSDDHVEDFVSGYFDDLAWAFGGDQSKVNAELLVWDYAYGTNFSRDTMQLTNTGTSEIKQLDIYKNKDVENSCSNWIIIEGDNTFQLAPDVIIWQKSTSSWGGMDTKVETYTQNVPHKISVDDIEAIQLLFEVTTYGKLAEMRGIPYTYPTIPNCPSTPKVQ